MKRYLEDSGQDMWSSKGGDSNALILPVEKGDKTRAKIQVHEPDIAKNDVQLSKSQKRKLKRLEEEKEKALRLSESIETLEKCKIRDDDVYSLLWSSRDIGQVETVREKRRRMMQFSKVGLEMSRSGQPFKRNVRLRAPIEMGLDTVTKSMPDLEDSCFPEPAKLAIGVPCNMPVSLGSTQKSVSDSRVRGTGESFTALPFAEVADCNIVARTLGDARNSSPSSCLHNVAKDRRDQSPKIDISNRSNLICSFQSVPISSTVVYVSRPNEIESKRMDLPIVMMEQEIMEAINESMSVIICGETGCGKTTQVPQFLYEAGFGSNQSSIRSGIIGVTQPRRVAVLATAKRVAFELGLRLGNEVGFQVRHDRSIGDRCSIMFMTDGILLREVQSDFLLRRYSVIILDEAHERSLNTDLLLVMLPRIVKTRQETYEEQHRRILSGETISPENKIFPLKLVIMSATLRVEDFVSNKEIFDPRPPVIEVPTRQYPVTRQFSKATDVDYVGRAYKKVLSIHKRQPAGGILVFVTGQREVEYLCKKLRNISRKMIEKKSRRNLENKASAVSEENADGNFDNQLTDGFSSYPEEHGDEDESDFSYDSETDSDLEVGDDGNLNVEKTLEVDGNIDDILGDDGMLTSLKAAFDALADKHSLNPSTVGKQVFSPIACSKLSNPTFVERMLGSGGHCAGEMRVLPLYAMLPGTAQLRVFEEIKEGERLVVVATNVAETSLTIPGIKYVVDTGKEKVKKFNSSNGVETYRVDWISKASAAQREGRAGRTGPGHCYRLYSSAVFNTFSDFSEAEISKVPLDGAVLLLKSMGIGGVENFPFPTRPEAKSLEEAERCLKVLGALDQRGGLTPLGKAMALYPMSPRHSSMLLTVVQMMRKVRGHARANLVLGYAIAAAAAMSMSNPFIRQSEGIHDEEECLNQDEKCVILEGKKKGLEKKEEKSKKEKLKVARAKFSNPSSDALTTAYALQCFELSGNPVEFCNENALHLKTMEEMSKLRKQLLQLVYKQNYHGLKHELSWTHGTIEDAEIAWKVPYNKHPLSLDEEGFLGQAVCAGWADRVAKRIRASSGSLEGRDRKDNALVCYQVCAVSEKVFLHRSSSLYRSAPKYLVYNELLKTGRSYILGATRVTPNWLVRYAKSLCSFSAPLADPKPYYEPLPDQVVCCVVPTFGPHLWKLPLHTLPIKDDVHRVAVFAYSLLEGHVLPCLRSVKKFMAAPPACIMRPEASGYRRVGNLLSKLKKTTRFRTIDSCAMLREAWNENPRELHSEIRDWFQKGFHDQFGMLWVEMQREVLLDPKDRFPEKVKKKGRGDSLFLD